MSSNYLFENIQILEGSNSCLKEGAVLISQGVIKAFGQKALQEGKHLGLQAQKTQHKCINTITGVNNENNEILFSNLVWSL